MLGVGRGATSLLGEGCVSLLGVSRPLMSAWDRALEAAALASALGVDGRDGAACNWIESRSLAKEKKNDEQDEDQPYSVYCR